MQYKNEIALLANRKQRIHAPEAKIEQWASSWVFFDHPPLGVVSE